MSSAYQARSSLRTANRVTGAVESMDREDIKSLSTSPLASGRCHFTYFTADVSQSISNIIGMLGGTAAGPTPTISRAGLYTVAANGDLACVAAIANNTALWTGTTFTEWSGALSANTVGGQAMPTSYAVQQGQRYAWGVVIVTAAAVPTFDGDPNGGAHWSRAPRLSAAINAQTDLPLSVASGSLSTSTARLWIMGN